MNKALIEIIFCSHYSSGANSGLIYMWILCILRFIRCFFTNHSSCASNRTGSGHKLLEAPEEPLGRKRTHGLDFIP